MNRVERIAWVGAEGRPAGLFPRLRHVPVEIWLLGVATAGELLGALTRPLAGAAAAIAVATVLTVRHMRAEVRALEEWTGVKNPTCG